MHRRVGKPWPLKALQVEGWKTANSSLILQQPPHPSLFTLLLPAFLSAALPPVLIPLVPLLPPLPFVVPEQSRACQDAPGTAPAASAALCEGGEGGFVLEILLPSETCKVFPRSCSGESLRGVEGGSCLFERLDAMNGVVPGDLLASLLPEHCREGLEAPSVTTGL